MKIDRKKHKGQDAANAAKEEPINNEEAVEPVEILDETEQEPSLEKQLEEKQRQNNELLDKLQRNLAEFDNFRKRTAKEKTSMYGDGVRDTVEKLLPVLDNFERAMQAVENKSDVFYKGIEMIYRQFTIMLFDLGVEEIPAIGESFDPNIHFAVAHVDDEQCGENEIIEELQKGYMHKEKVIRHSMVKVAN